MLGQTHYRFDYTTPSLETDMNPLTPYPITPVGSFLGCVLALLPLISHIRKLSLAVWGYALWIAVDCFQTFVNTIIWHDNVNIVAPVWCDIGEKPMHSPNLTTCNHLAQ